MTSFNLPSLLRSMSVGKVNQGLFFRGSQTYSTITGGLITVLMAGIMLVFSGSLLYSVFSKSLPENFETTMQDINHWADYSLYSIGSPENHFIKAFVFYLDPLRFPTCESLAF